MKFQLLLGEHTIEKGEPRVKIRYKVQRDKTRLYMFDENGKLVHQTPLALDRFRDGRERTETYVWKLYRTEWTSDIDVHTTQ